MTRTEPFRKHTQKVIMTPCLSFVDPEKVIIFRKGCYCKGWQGLLFGAS